MIGSSSFWPAQRLFGATSRYGSAIILTTLTGSIYVINKKELQWYIERNPGFLLRIKDCVFIDALEDPELQDVIEVQKTKADTRLLRRASRLGVFQSMEIVL